jgi:hypothetical protein
MTLKATTKVYKFFFHILKFFLLGQMFFTIGVLFGFFVQEQVNYGYSMSKAFWNPKLWLLTVLLELIWSVIYISAVYLVSRIRNKEAKL